MKIYELLSTPDKWTQNHFARNKDGLPVIPSNPAACCWCLDGAALICYSYGDYLSVRSKLEKVIQNKYNQSLIEFNDFHTYDEVFALVKELDV